MRQWLLTFACVRFTGIDCAGLRTIHINAQVPMFDSAASCVAGCCRYTPLMWTRVWHSQALSLGSSARPFIGYLDQIENLSGEWKMCNRGDWHFWKRQLLNKRRSSGFKVASSFCLSLTFHAICTYFLKLQCICPLPTRLLTAVSIRFHTRSL